MFKETVTVEQHITKELTVLMGAASTAAFFATPEGRQLAAGASVATLFDVEVECVYWQEWGDCTFRAIADGNLRPFHTTNLKALVAYIMENS